MDKDLPLSAQRPIAEELLGQGTLAWEPNQGRKAAPGSIFAYVTCPGIEAHTGKDAPRDCRVYLDPHGPASVYCAHTSCQAARDAVTFAIRSAIGKKKVEGREMKAEKKERRKQPMIPLPPLQVRVPAPRQELEKPSGKSDSVDAGESRTIRTIRTIHLDNYQEWEGAALSAAKKVESKGMKDEISEPHAEPVALKEAEPKLVTAIYPRTGEIYRGLLKADQVEHTAYLGQEWKPDDFYD